MSIELFVENSVSSVLEKILFLGKNFFIKNMDVPVNNETEIRIKKISFIFFNEVSAGNRLLQFIVFK